MIDYDTELNPQQLEVVRNGNGACLVLAGAGSGKTRTITYRVAYLLEQEVMPENILLLTFTNKAAQEMINRIQELTKMVCAMPYGGTFHSIANKILRRYAGVIGYENNFTILDSDDSISLIKICIKECKPDTASKYPSARVVQSMISYARNSMCSIEEVLDMKYPQFLEFAPSLGSVSSGYERKKKEANAMDFDDLLLNFLLLLNNPKTLEKFAEQFKYILVDEYQDTNKIQASIIRKLSLRHNNVLVVGDDAQSIYSFRAADIANILDFEKKYSGAKVFKLETNYRSSSEILDVANEVISNNLRQYKKDLNTICTTGVRPLLEPHSDQRSEAIYIAKTIKNQIANEVRTTEIAVLFRAAFHSQMLEMELMKNNIEYDYRGGLRFFDRAHIKDVLAYLRILNNLADTAAWLRVLLHEEGIGAVAAQKIIALVKTASSIEEIARLGNDNIRGRAKQGWYNFLQIWTPLLEIDKNDIAALIMRIKESDYRNYLENEYTDARERLEDIEQLAVFAEGAESLDSFLSEASLQEGFNARTATSNTSSRNKIVLSTIHQAKGLEWENVFIMNVASGAFPSDRAWQERDSIEEERRLFYVAITRAKKNLYLTYPQQGSNWGSGGGPSIFLDEIPTDLIECKTSFGDLTVFDNEIEDVRYVVDDDFSQKKKGGGFLIDV